MDTLVSLNQNPVKAMEGVLWLTHTLSIMLPLVFLQETFPFSSEERSFLYSIYVHLSLKQSHLPQCT